MYPLAAGHNHFSAPNVSASFFFGCGMAAPSSQRSLLVRQEHFSTPNFSAFVSFELRARSCQSLCVSTFWLQPFACPEKSSQRAKILMDCSAEKKVRPRWPVSLRPLRSLRFISFVESIIGGKDVKQVGGLTQRRKEMDARSVGIPLRLCAFA